MVEYGLNGDKDILKSVFPLKIMGWTSLFCVEIMELSSAHISQMYCSRISNSTDFLCLS